MDDRGFRGPAFPKYQPLIGGELVRFRLTKGGSLRPGYVLPPDGAPDDAEIEGDIVCVRPVHGARVYTVDRSLVKKLSGARLMQIQQDVARPTRRSSRAPASVLLPRTDEADVAGPRVIYSGPTALRSIPKPTEPPRSRRYMEFVHLFACIGCPAQASPTEAHHHGKRANGRKCSDYRCVPLCVECHRCITDTHKLPGLTRAETDRLIAGIQLDLHDAWFADADADQPQTDASFLLRPAPDLPLIEGATEPTLLVVLEALHVA